MQVGERKPSRARRVADGLDDRIKSNQRLGEVAVISGDALIARAKHRVFSIHTVERGTSGARRSLIARPGSLPEILTTGPLQDIAAQAGHVANLPAGRQLQRLLDHRVVPLDGRVIFGFTHTDECAESQTLVRAVDLLIPRRQTVDIHQHAWLHDPQRHIVRHVGPAGDELPGDRRRHQVASRSRPSRRHGGLGSQHRALRARRAPIRKGPHALLRLHGTARVLNRRDDIRIRCASAQIAAHVLANILWRLGVSFVNACNRRHDLARGAIAALKRIVIDERLLHRMKRAALRAQAFDCRDLMSLTHASESHARQRALAIDVNRASATLPVRAALLGAREPGMIADRIQ